jgi:hypothetical protein
LCTDRRGNGSEAGETQTFFASVTPPVPIFVSTPGWVV